MSSTVAAQIMRQADAVKNTMSESGRAFSELWVTRQKLEDLYKKMLLLDLEYALDKKVEQELWNHAFKNQINTLQNQAKDRQNPKKAEAQASLNLFLETASGFYLQFLQMICSTFKLDLPFRRRSAAFGIMRENTINYKHIMTPKKSSCLYICCHCLVHLGDIARYRQQTEQAQTYYRHAANLSPNNGQPYNQLAILEASRGDKLSTVFYYIRSLAVRHPFPVAATNLEKFYSKLIKDASFGAPLHRASLWGVSVANSLDGFRRPLILFTKGDNKQTPNVLAGEDLDVRDVCQECGNTDKSLCDHVQFTGMRRGPYASHMYDHISYPYQSSDSPYVSFRNHSNNNNSLNMSSAEDGFLHPSEIYSGHIPEEFTRSDTSGEFSGNCADWGTEGSSGNRKTNSSSSCGSQSISGSSRSYSSLNSLGSSSAWSTDSSYNSPNLPVVNGDIARELYSPDDPDLREFNLPEQNEPNGEFSHGVRDTESGEAYADIPHEISEPENSSIGNEISEPDSSNIGREISEPDSSNIGREISEPDSSNIGHVISELDSGNIDHEISEPYNSNIIPELNGPHNNDMAHGLSGLDNGDIDHVIIGSNNNNNIVHEISGLGNGLANDVHSNSPYDNGPNSSSTSDVPEMIASHSEVLGLVENSDSNVDEDTTNLDEPISDLGMAEDVDEEHFIVEGEDDQFVERLHSNNSMNGDHSASIVQHWDNDNQDANLDASLMGQQLSRT